MTDYQCDICKAGMEYPGFVGLSLRERGIYYFCDACFQRMLTNDITGRREVEFDVNAAVAHAMNGPQVVLADECCQSKSTFPNEYSALDHPKILPPEDITLTPEQLELLAPHTVVAGRLE